MLLDMWGFADFHHGELVEAIENRPDHPSPFFYLAQDRAFDRCEVEGRTGQHDAAMDGQAIVRPGGLVEVVGEWSVRHMLGQNQVAIPALDSRQGPRDVVIRQVLQDLADEHDLARRKFILRQIQSPEIHTEPFERLGIEGNQGFHDVAGHIARAQAAQARPYMEVAAVEIHDVGLVVQGAKEPSHCVDVGLYDGVGTRPAAREECLSGSMRCPQAPSS